MLEGLQLSKAFLEDHVDSISVRINRDFFLQKVSHRSTNSDSIDLFSAEAHLVYDGSASALSDLA